jgi:hypothetical protein
MKNNTPSDQKSLEVRMSDPAYLRKMHLDDINFANEVAERLEKEEKEKLTAKC